MDILYPLCRLCRQFTDCLPTLLFSLFRCHLQEGGQSTIQRHSFIRMSKLPDVRGRITYISSRTKQENLYAVYETTDRPYWTELAKCNQQEFQKSGTEGKCIEAREFIIALPESFPNLYDPDKLLQLFTDRFKEKYDVECVSALHHNKRKTNYHIHLIFSERELSAKFFEKEVVQMVTEPSEERTLEKVPQTDKKPKQEHNLLKELIANPSAQKQELQSQTQVTEQETPQIPPKPVVSTEAAAYPKLLKIYKELNRQNGIIFDAERERNELELERDSLKGFAKLTKKGELQSRIDRKNEEIDLLKVGLSGIIKRYGYQNVQEFYQIYRKSYNAYIACKEQVTKWEKTYGDDNQKKSKESVLERLRNPPKKTADYQQQGILKGKDRGAR